MDARLWPALEQYRRLIGDVQHLRTILEGYRAQAAIDTTVKSLANWIKGIADKQALIASHYSAAVANVASTLHGLFGDENYNLLGELQALAVLVNAVKDELILVVPISADGSLNERTVTVSSETLNVVSAASLSGLRAALDTAIADIVINGGS